MKLSGILVGLILCVIFTGVSFAGMPEGVIAHWMFNEGSGTTAFDATPNGHDGVIRGARYVPHGDGYALEFDGTGEHVDFGAPPELDLNEEFSLELWIRFPLEVEGHQLRFIAGKSIGYYGFLFAPMSRTAWWFAPNPHAKGSVSIVSGRLHHLVGTYDRGEAFLYIDGQESWWNRNSLRSEEGQIRPNRNVSFSIGAAPGVERDEEVAGSSFRGLISEAAVYSRALSADEVRGLYEGGNLTGKPELSASYVPPVGKIAVDVQSRPLGDLPDGSDMRVSISRGGEKVAERSEPLVSRAFRSFEFDTSALSPGDYEVSAEAFGPGGGRIGGVSVVSVTLPVSESRFPEETPYGTRLNNLVTEMVRVEEVPDGADSFYFEREREGWTFVSLDLEMGVGDAAEVLVVRADGHQESWLKVDGSSVQEPWQGEGGRWELMRRLPAGRHELRIRRDGDTRPGRLIVRAVPHLGWYEASRTVRIPHEGDRGPEFYGERVLRNCNFFVYGVPRTLLDQDRPFISRWRASGRKALLSVYLPRPPRWTDEQMKPEEMARNTIENSDPEMDGVSMDELHGLARYAETFEQYARLFHEETNQAMYVAMGSVYRYPALERFLAAAVETGGKPWFEAYSADARSLLGGWRGSLGLVNHMAGFRKNMARVAPHIVVGLGTFSVPTASLHHWPEADFKAHIDLMMNVIANNPEFFDISGVMNYKGRHMEKELVDWFSSLCRHYFIEGRREMLSDTPYILRYVDNPGFVDGLDRWEVQAAEEGSVRADTFAGFAALQGQAWPVRHDPSGDRVVVMRRSANKPNRISQTLNDLTPGRLYAVSVASADYHDMTGETAYPLSIDVNVGEENEVRRYSYAFNNLNWVTPDYPERSTAWMNYHRLVFRATGTEAEVTVSDWERSGEPGGHLGQELMISFVEVKPYFSPDHLAE